MLGGGLALRSASHPVFVKTGQILCAVTVLSLAAIAVLPVGTWALTPLENRLAFNPPDQVDGVIVLGGDENTEVSEARGVPTALDSMRRYVTFAEMARRYPDAKLVFSGGSGLLHPRAPMEDSEVARRIMTAIGVPMDRVIFEKTSRNTYENAVFSADIARPEAAQKWLLVTSAWHMPRAIGCFRKAGWNIDPAPTGYFTTGKYQLHPLFQFEEQLHMLTLAEHEYVGLVAYWLMGRTSALWPE